MTQPELAERAGSHERTIQNAESGRQAISIRTQRSLEDALDWKPGTIARMYAGAPEPEPQSNHRKPERSDDALEFVEVDGESVRLQLPGLAELLRDPTIKPSAKRALIDQLIDDQQETVRRWADFLRSRGSGPSAPDE